MLTPAAWRETRSSNPAYHDLGELVPNFLCWSIRIHDLHAARFFSGER